MPKRHLLTAAIAQLLITQAAQAAVITVDTNAETIAVDGACSLREALINASADNQSGSVECAAGSGVDVVALPANQTITLTSPLAIINSAVTIQGNGSRVERSTGLACNTDNTLDAGEFRVLHIDAAGTTSISDLIVANGCQDGGYGGGIYSLASSLSLNNVTAIDNHALYGGGVWAGAESSGAVTIEHSHWINNNAGVSGIDGRGGGLFLGTNTISNISDSTFSGNSASTRGGGLFATGDHSIASSTFDNNTAMTSGGGLFNSGTLTLRSSTLSRNTAMTSGGGIEADGTTVDLSDSTFAYNSAPLGKQFRIIEATTSSTRNLFASEVASGDNCANSTPTTGPDNFSTDASNCGTVTAASTAELGLQPLANNGGPTKTHALGHGSVAIDAAGNGCSGTDQRGVARPFGSACDAGAFEVDEVAQASAGLSVNAADDLGDGFCGAAIGECTLRDAVLAANSDLAFSTVSFNQTVFGTPQTVTLTQGQMNLTAPFFINGTGVDQLTVDADGASRHFEVDDGNDANAMYAGFVGLRLTGGSSSTGGGAVLSREALILDSMVFEGNSAASVGGALEAQLLTADSISLQDTIFRQNGIVSGFGGGAYIRGTDAAVSISNTTLEANTAGDGSAGGRGGGLSVRLDNGSLLLADSVFSANSAACSNVCAGAGMYITAAGSSVSLQDSQWINNTGGSTGSRGAGSGLFIEATAGASITLDDAVITGNTSGGTNSTSRRGGGGYWSVEDSTLTVHRATISGNSAGNKGGALYLGLYVGGQIDIVDSTVSANESGGVGGAIYAHAYGDSRFTIANSTLSDNVSANRGGGLDAHVYISALLSIAGSTISGNSAGADGGGINAKVYNDGQLQLTDSTLSGNTSIDTAGGIYAFVGGPNSVITLDRSTVTGNTADSDASDVGSGGGIYAYASGGTGTIALNGTVVTDNVDLGSAPNRDVMADPNTVVLLSNSLIGDNSGSALAEAPLGMPDANNNLIGDPLGAGVIDAKLRALADNGGLTLTHVPALDSPLLDHYDGCIGDDQRGVARGVDFDGVAGNDCDIGAVEHLASDDVIFADGLEAAPIPLVFLKHGATLQRSAVAQRLVGGRYEKPTLIARATSPGVTGMALIEARRIGNDVQLRVARYQQGHWLTGAWQTFTGDSVELRW